MSDKLAGRPPFVPVSDIILCPSFCADLHPLQCCGLLSTIGMPHIHLLSVPRMPWEDPAVAAAAAAAAAASRLPGAIPKSIAQRRAEFEVQEAEKMRNAALGVRVCNLLNQFLDVC